MSKGWTKEQAMGLAANIQAESGFDPSKVGDSGKAYGIAQWRDSRRARYQQKFGKPLEGTTFQEQLEYMNWELNNTEFTAASKLRGARTAEQAASVVDEYYERSNGAHRQKRIQIASNYNSFETGSGLVASMHVAPRTSAVSAVTAQNQSAWQNYSVVTNTDNRTTNVVNGGRNVTGKDANPYDQLFAMLFMDHNPTVQ